MLTPRIPGPPLVAAERFSARLAGEDVARALAVGLAAGGLPGAWTLELTADTPLQALAGAPLHTARAVVLGVAQLGRQTLGAGAAFELATRARQGGVPAYAVCTSDELDAFDARMIDLQLILRVRGQRSLERAGEELARAMLGRVVSAGRVEVARRRDAEI